MGDLQISAFPQGDGLWRVDWFGGVQFPNRVLRRTQPSVFVHLSKVTDPAVLADSMASVSASSTLPWQRQFKCWVSVGATMLLRIGDLWSDQRFIASPEHEVETFEKLSIDRSTTKLLKVGHSDDQGNFLLPAAEHPWHMANTHSYCVRVALANGRSLVIPCMELARFYFGSSSPLLTALFLPPFDRTKLYSSVQLDGFFGEDVVLDLAEGIPKESAQDIGRIAASKQASNAAAMIGVSLLRQAPEGVDDIYPQCVFPFEGETTLKASGKWLSLGSQQRATFLVYRLRSCSYPFPFDTLKFRTSGQKRQPWKPAVSGGGAAGSHSRSGAPDAKDPTLRERDASGALAPRTRRGFREVKFPDLQYKRIWSEVPLDVSSAPIGSRGATAVADLAVGEPGSVQRIRSITLVEALGQPDGPPAFLRPAIERLRRLKRLNVTLLTASVDDGWTVPVPYTVSEDGEIPPEVFIEDGGGPRIRRVAAFVIRGGRRQVRVVVDEAESGALYVDRTANNASLSSVLTQACIKDDAWKFERRL